MELAQIGTSPELKRFLKGAKPKVDVAPNNIIFSVCSQLLQALHLENDEAEKHAKHAKPINDIDIRCHGCNQ